MDFGNEEEFKKWREFWKSRPAIYKTERDEIIATDLRELNKDRPQKNHFKKVRCCFCGNIVRERDLSIEHVVPWSEIWPVAMFDIDHMELTDEEMREARKDLYSEPSNLRMSHARCNSKAGEKNGKKQRNFGFEI